MRSRKPTKRHDYILSFHAAKLSGQGGDGNGVGSMGVKRGVGSGVGDRESVRKWLRSAPNPSGSRS
eukprot:1123420-Rhodomonas_salina.2